MRRVQFYIKDGGRSPVAEFIASLPSKLKQKVNWTLRIVADMAIVPTEYLKKLDGTDQIWEIRVHFGNDALRLLGFFDGKDLIILTNGFLKKTEKVPQREIKLAEERKKDYLWKKRN